MGAAFLSILVHHLEAVIVNVLFVKERDVFYAAVIAFEDLHMIILHLACLLYNPVIGPGNVLGKKPVPFVIGKSKVIEQFQLTAQVGDETCFIGDGDIVIALSAQAVDKILFHGCFTLIVHIAQGLCGIFGHNGGFIRSSHDIIGRHWVASFSWVRELEVRGFDYTITRFPAYSACPACRQAGGKAGQAGNVNSLSR